MITRQGPFSAERATEVILQLAAALELAHTSGIIHRDVKPGNILIKSDGTAKLGDFGMAISSRRNEPTVRAGTPHYFAPEIWRGEPASIATDIYALGATYYYLLTGRPPIDAPNIAALSVAHQQQELVAPPELASGPGAACMRVVRRCMAKAASDRYESASAVAWEARGVLRELASPWIAQQAASEAPTRRTDTTPPALRDSSPTWQARGFRFEPFASLDPAEPPYRGAPFDGLRQELGEQLAASGTTVIIAGAPSSGRSVLARSVLAAHGKRGTYIDLAHPSSRSGTLIQRIARAFGAVANPAAGGNPEIEGLLEVLAVAPPGQRVPLIVIDGVAAGTRAAADVAVLARAARSTRYFSMLIVGPAELSAEFGGAILASAVAVVPPLGWLAVHEYLAAWLRVTRLPDAPPLIVTIDAALMAGYHAGGSLEQLNAIARQMITTGGPVVTSWDAWNAATASRQGTPLSSVRPLLWPTPEVLHVINQCRVAAGIAERASLDHEF
jgi:hypothetical protein